MSNTYLVLFLLFTANTLLSRSSDNDDTLTISPLTGSVRINVNFNVTNNKSFSSSSPNPDITILSQKYYLCLWSYVIKNENGTYSNEIYSNLFSSETGKSQVRNEYLLNRIRGYSQDTPSASTLFNISNHLTHGVAVVWESQINDPLTGSVIDAVFGRIIHWSITAANGYRYVKVTSPTAQEFQISSPSIDYLHHKNPSVIPIYNTGKFLVSWISHDNNKNINYNMVFIRIYYNGGKPYSDQIQIHDTDLYWKKYPRSIPLLHNLTLISWLTQSYDNQLIVYGMIFDRDGTSKLPLNNDQGRHTFATISDSTDHTIYDQTIPVIAHLHNDPYKNNNFFVLGYNSINEETKTNTMYASVYAYNDITNTITQISDGLTPLFNEPYDSTKHIIQTPQMENIINELYELEDGLSAKIAVCWSIKDLLFSKSDILCKIIEITLWDSGDSLRANIETITNEIMINDLSASEHLHEQPSLSSESILRAQTDYTDSPQFVVVWSNSRVGGYDVYTKILQLDYGNVAPQPQPDTPIFGSQLNVIIIGVVFGVILVVLSICICNHFYMKHKDNLKLKPRSKMQQLGEESDEEDDDDTIAGYNNTNTQNNNNNNTITQIHDDDDDDDDDMNDGLQLTKNHSL